MNLREGKSNTKSFLHRNGNSEVYNGCGMEYDTLDTTTLGPFSTEF